MRFWLMLPVLCFALAAPASAQATSTQLPPIRAAVSTIGNINVQGRATLRVPADGIRIEATIAGGLDQAESDAVLARLKSGGLESPQSIASAYIGNGNTTTVRAILRRPTPERLESVMKLTVAILAEHPTLRLQNATLTPFLDDCAPVESKVRRAAFEDARKRATDIAQAAGVGLSSVINLSELGGSSCTSLADLSARMGGGNPGLEREPAVYVTISEAVSFLIVRVP